ncbi:hypothetical protein CFHF_02435 [Caulobacter flavus]|uniref:Uncharacterized protein n=2 Tax=Caulobacter flavus TaxID=1679497 RepID=A0A2N5D233_9CAUL|nr:hypothetical protein C1707_11335 [Caulobacter flavus]PLR20046.1 hypothetical protein CFHF_02435 [Caulobacter flavus]
MRLLVAAAIVSPLASFWYRAEHQFEIEKRAEEAIRWSLDGVPCPTADARAFAASSRPPLGATFQAVRLSRHVGHMQCASHVYRLEDGRHDAQVCDFTGPGVVAVETSAARAYWAPPAAARVVVIDGQPRCLQRERFRMGE